MNNIRIIPRLDVKGPNLVKGIHFEGLRVLGPPEYFARQYYEQGADELIYIDIVASLYERNNLKEIVSRTAQQVFIPITVGGGIRSIEDMRLLLRAGADKVAINTAAIRNPNLIREGTEIFGSQCIVVSIEAKKIQSGKYEAFTDNGRQKTGVDVFEWVYKVCELGAGEILITSVDCEGTGEGYDIELISKVSEIASVPVIACGGAGRLEDIEEVVKHTKVNAVSAASIFHYKQLSQELVIKEYKEGNTEFLEKYVQTNYKFKRIQPLTICELKLQMKKSNMVFVRDMETDCIIGDIGSQTNEYNFNILSNKPLVIVVDYGCGNLFSLEHVLKEIGADFKISDDPEVIIQADRLILPGVGAFGEGMRNLKEKGLVEPIKEYVKAGKPLIGICLGMHLLMRESEEFGTHAGLGFIEGRVLKLQIPKLDSSNIKIPHIGWNQIGLPYKRNECYTKNNIKSWDDTILKNISQESFMYFVHSYIVMPDNSDCIVAETEYGHNRFCSVIQDGNVYGCQFHPEKSGKKGLEIFRNFICGINEKTSIVM